MKPLRAWEAAALLGMHVNSVKRIPPEALPFFRVGTRGDRRYWRSDVQQYIESRTEGRLAR